MSHRAPLYVFFVVFLILGVPAQAEVCSDKDHHGNGIPAGCTPPDMKKKTPENTVGGEKKSPVIDGSGKVPTGHTGGVIKGAPAGENSANPGSGGSGHGGSHIELTAGAQSEAPTVPVKDMLAKLKTDAAAFSAERPDLAKFAQTAASRIAARVQAKPDATFAQKELVAYITMMEFQAQKTDTFKAFRDRQPPPTREEFQALRTKFEGEAEKIMHAAGIPHGDFMNVIHEEAGVAWREQWRDRRDPDPDGGRPSRTHIDGMLRGNPRNPGNWSLSAADKLANGDKAGGMDALNRSISLGGTPEAFGMRGALRLDAKDYDGAYQDAKKALELNPGDKNAMGILKSAEGRTTPGLAASLSAGGAGSAGAGAAAGSGGAGSAAYANANRGGIGGFDPGRVREIAGMTTAATLSSGQKLDEARRAMALNDHQAAIMMAQRAIELNPNNAAAYGFLSTIYARKGDYKNAIAASNAGLAVSPRDASLLNSKAFAENRSKLYRDALGTSNGAIEADARNPNSYANRAHAYGGLGDKDAMMSDINRAAAMDPAFQQAAADAAALQLPSKEDILFLFPGENPEAPAPAAPAKGRSFGLVVGAGLAGGLLLALGLLSTVLAPIKDSVVSAFTKATRRGPSVHALEEDSTPETLPAPSATGLIRGQYEISRQIGAGGMGMVYEGTDRSLDRRVAIKKMRDELRINPRERERFVIEAKTVASLHHPNIVDIYAIAEESDDVYLVFEYVDGKTIHDLVQAKGRLIPADAVRVTQAISTALTYAHSRGVIHRDMKPSNVMLTKGGEIKVMDFGIARMAKDAMTRYSMTNTVVGTPPYMAPEQEQGVVRKESDVYSLAVCAYEMMTGKLPFVGIGAGMLMNKINMSYIPPSRNIAGLPEALDEVFLKAFQADPDQRYHTPQEFSAALDAASGGVRSSGHAV